MTSGNESALIWPETADSPPTGEPLAADTPTAEKPPAKEPKKFKAPQKFYKRLEREGRYKDFNRRVRAMGKENGKYWGQNKWVAMREFGYTTPEAEHKLHALWESQQAQDAEAVIDEKVAEKVVIVKSVQSFEDALVTLPVKGDPQTENDWILAHPAMARKSRSKNNLEPVMITGSDILTADHGPAPSRAAAIKLQYWANKPDELYKALTGAVKKSDASKEGDKTDSGEEIEDLSEIERLLKEVA